MIDEINFDSCSSHYWDQGSSALPEETAPPMLTKPVDEEVSSLRSSQRKFRGSLFSIDLSTARRESDLKTVQIAPTPIKSLDEKVTLTSTKILEAAHEKTKTHSEKSQKHKYTMQMQTKGGEAGQYVLGIGEMALGAGLMVAGAAIEVGSLGTLTVAVAFEEAAAVALVADGFGRTMRNRDISLDRNKPPTTWKNSDLYAPDSVYNPNDDFYIFKGERKSSDEPRAPPVRGDQLVGDGKMSPGQGFDEWKGQSAPESNKGSWVRGNGKTRDSVHPDLNHPEHGPHWDYVGPNFPDGARLYPDGTWEPKR